MKDSEAREQIADTRRRVTELECDIIGLKTSDRVRKMAVNVYPTREELFKRITALCDYLDIEWVEPSVIGVYRKRKVKKNGTKEK